MIRTFLPALTCLAPFLLAPASAAPVKSPKPVAVSAKKDAPNTARIAAAVHRKAPRSRERIFTYKPRPVQPGKESEKAATVYRASGSQDPFLGFSPIDNSVIGVGLWRMPKLERLDPNRNNPLRDTSGRTTKAAAVGVKLNF